MAEPRFLILGGAGYFGARLAEALQARGEVVITQRRSSPERDDWITRRKLAVCHYDSSNGELPKVDGNFEAVIHLASPGAAEAARDPRRALQSALAGVTACLDMLDAGRAKRLLHFSTFHVYGAGGRAVFDEDDTPDPIHPYGQTHLACEQKLAGEKRAWVVRPTNMVGAPAHADLGDQAKLLFLDLCRQAAAGAMKLNNDGLSHRDFLPFDDAISAVELLLSAPENSPRLLNLSLGKSMRLDEVADMIQQAAGERRPTLELGAGQDAFRQSFVVSNQRLRSLGWQPAASMKETTTGIIRFFS